MQDETSPICVWVVSEPPEEDRRCSRPAKYEYSKRVQDERSLPHVERYTMCGKHASQKNRDRAESLGYTVKEIEFEA